MHVQIGEELGEGFDNGYDGLELNEEAGLQINLELIQSFFV